MANWIRLAIDKSAICFMQNWKIINNRLFTHFHKQFIVKQYIRFVYRHIRRDVEQVCFKATLATENWLKRFLFNSKVFEIHWRLSFYLRLQFTLWLLFCLWIWMEKKKSGSIEMIDNFINCNQLQIQLFRTRKVRVLI